MSADQVIGRMLDRVAILAGQTDQRGVYHLQMPPVVLQSDDRRGT